MSSQTTASNRGCAWSDEEVKALLAVWGEGNIQEELDGAVRNKTVFVNISKKMSESGHDRDWQQCRVKIKNLKKNYRDVKDHNGETGRGRKTCKFFKELDAILGHRPASVPSVLLDTGATSQSSSSSAQPDESAAEGEANEGDDIPATTPLDTALDSGNPSNSRDAEDGHTNSEPASDEAGPPRKRQRTQKKGKLERALDYALSSFAKHQHKETESYRKYEDERWEKQMELEEKRRREDMEHEERMMQMMARVFQRPSPYNFNTEEYPYDSHY